MSLKKIAAILKGTCSEFGKDKVLRQLVDVRVPTTDGRELVLVRRTEPERDVALLLARLKLELPPQSPPRISAGQWH